MAIANPKVQGYDSAMARILVELARVVVALVFSALAFLQIVRMEWFDTLRWGPPSAPIATAYAAWTVFAGLIGWLLAAAVTSRRLWAGVSSPS